MRGLEFRPALNGALYWYKLLRYTNYSQHAQKDLLVPLTRITFTGIDEHCPIEQLLELARMEPRLEFGILYQGDSQPSRPRYPDPFWLTQTAMRLYGAGVALALHVCKDSVLNGIRFKEILPARSFFGRIQLNKRIPDEHLKDLSEFIGWVDPVKVITQEPVNPALHLRISFANHQILFDASGGRGVLPERWPEPIEGHECGYAGGLGPERITEALPHIFAAAGPRSFWIDMETGLRDEHDAFSIEKAQKTLRLIAKAERSINPGTSVS